MVRRIWKSGWAIVLAAFLTACGLPIAGPSHQLVEQAIALQLRQTQAELSQQLRLDAQQIALDIKRVVIAEQKPLTIENLRSFRVRGTYNITTKLPTQQVTEQENPFEVYLQRQPEGKTWRLAHREADDNGEPIWVMQPLS